MSRVSLGIILPGNPQCVQKERLWMKILNVVCETGALVSIIGAVVFMILSIAINSISGYWTVKFIGLLLIFLFVQQLIWDEKFRCPYCKHFYTMKRISKDKYVGSSEKDISRNVNDYGSGMAYDWDGNMTFFNTKSSHTEYGKEVKKIYTYNMRCKCCGCVNKVDKEKVIKSF